MQLLRLLARFALVVGVSMLLAQPAASAPRASLTVAVTRSADAVPFFYALKSGLFAKSDLDVRDLAMANGAAIASAIVGGAADIGFSNVQTLIAAHVKGIPFTIVAPGGEYNDASPTTELLVAGDSPIKTAKDLEGKTVAVGALHDLQALSVAAWMTSSGADSTKASFIETPASAAFALLQQGRAAAIVVSQPNLEFALQRGARVLGKPYSALAKRLLVSAWYTTQGWSQANAPAVARFAQVMRAASEYVNAHPAEMDPLISDYTRIPTEALRTMSRARQGTGVDVSQLQAVIDAAARYEVIPKSFPARDIITGAP